MKDIPLVAFEPTGPRCRTRFALPVGYKLTPIRDGGSGAAFVPNPAPGQDEQQRYLTPETTLTLFERARWYTLRVPDASTSGSYWQVYEAEIGAETIQVKLSLPTLVLFEFSETRDDPMSMGFLMVDAELDSNGHLGLNHLLDFNEGFRYLQVPFTEHVSRRQPWVAGLRRVGPVDEPAAADDYLSFWSTLLQCPLRGSDNPTAQSWSLFPSEWHDRAVDWLAGRPTAGMTPEATSGWAINPDIRAFVWTLAVTEKGTADATSTSSGEWYGLLNADPSRWLCSSLDGFARHWAREHTYTRWKSFHSLYGFSPYSGAAWVPRRTGDLPNLPHHFFTHYWHLVLMLLYLKVCSFRFSHQLSITTARWRDTGRHRDVFTPLRRQFAQFTNLYRFPLLSNQQQALEMYTLARHCFDVDELFAEVQSEIRSTDEFLDGIESAAQTTEATALSIIALGGLAATLGLGLYQLEPGANWQAIEKFVWREGRGLLALTAVWVGLLLAAATVQPAFRKFRRWLEWT